MAVAGWPARSSCSTDGASLQPQPPPWARLVRRIVLVVMRASVTGSGARLQHARSARAKSSLGDRKKLARGCFGPITVSLERDELAAQRTAGPGVAQERRSPGNVASST